MNKIITIYDLLGLIKDGKAPKKIKWNNKIWTFKNKKDSVLFKYNYTDENNEIIEDWLVLDSLEDEVQILDEEDEFIEMTEILEANDYIEYRINQLIHNQKILIEKMKDKE